MLTDGRVDVIGDIGKFNEILGNIVKYFGKEWLESSGPHPLKFLWKRHDALASLELSIFGDCIIQSEKINEERTKVFVEKIKTSDPKGIRGNVYEVLAGAIFQNPDYHTAEFAPLGQKAYDLIINLNGGKKKINLSVKNLGIKRCDEFVSKSREVESIIQSKIRIGFFSNIAIYKDRTSDAMFPDIPDWGGLETELPHVLDLDSIKNEKKGWTIFKNEQGQNVEPFSDMGINGQPHSLKASYSLVLFAPLHKNDPQNFIDKLELSKFVAFPESDMSLNAVFAHVPLEINLDTCENKIREYMEKEENQDLPVSIFILYQPTVINLDVNEVGLAHCYKVYFRTKRIQELKFGNVKLRCHFLLGIPRLGSAPINIAGKFETDDTDYYSYSAGHAYLQQVGKNIYKKYLDGLLVETVTKSGEGYNLKYPFPASDKLILL
jgi:hypothetical protein